MAYDLNCVCFTPIPQTIHQKKSWTQHGPALFPQLLLARMRLPRCQPWMRSVPLKLARWNPSLVPRNNGLSRMYGKQTMLRGIVTGCLSVWAYPFHSQSRKLFMKQKLVQLYHIVFVWLTTVLTSWRGHHFYFVVGLERTSAIVWKPFGKRFAATILDTQFMRNMQMSWTKLFLTAFMEMKVKGQSVLPSWIFRLKHPWDWICLMKALPPLPRKRFQRMHAFWFQLVRFVMTWIPAMSAAHGAWTTMRVGTATWNATCFLAFRMPGTKKANITFCTNTWSLWLRRQQVFLKMASWWTTKFISVPLWGWRETWSSTRRWLLGWPGAMRTWGRKICWKCVHFAGQEVPIFLLRRSLSVRPGQAPCTEIGHGHLIHLSQRFRLIHARQSSH